MAQTDRDLASIAEARALARRAKAVAPALGEFSQEQRDAIVDAIHDIGAVLAEHFPKRGGDTNELADKLVEN